MTAARDPWLDEQEALRRDVHIADELKSPPASHGEPGNPWNEYDPGDDQR